jgi:hypothetical protein
MSKPIAKEFYDSNLATALENCLKAGYNPKFMPELADARINGKAEWGRFYSAPSIRATGKTEQGSKVVVYAHIPNYFSNPENIRKAVEMGLINGAGIMPSDEFQKLLDVEDGKKVFVVDYDKLKNSKSGIIPLSDAMEHPQTIPFLGGQERAEKYLAKHKEAYNTNQIGIWHNDDLKENPVGRLLFLGNNDGNGLYGNLNVLNNVGRFLGVRSGKVAEGDAKKIKAPSLNDILKVSKDYVSKSSRAEFEQHIRELYK